jgi:hypothetical protein
MAWPAAVRQVALVPAGAAGSGTDPAGPSGALPGNGRLNGTRPDAEAPVADVVIPAATVPISSMTAAVRDIIGRAERGKDILCLLPRCTGWTARMRSDLWPAVSPAGAEILIVEPYRY